MDPASGSGAVRGGPTRRDLLAAGLAWPALGLVSSDDAASPPSSRDLDQDRLDEALERLEQRLPDGDVHRSNHVPMVAEALCVLGRSDAIEAWVDRHLDERGSAPPAHRAIDAARWREALGDDARWCDWRDHFRREVAEAPWQEVLRRWLPRLAPGLAGSATHGVIRTAHAARALAARESAVRRGALANGLAYWAATYEELPWDGTHAPAGDIASALARVVPRRPAIEPPAGNIVAGLRALGSTSSFAPTAGLVDVADPVRTIGEITRAFARLYLANPDRRIAFTHAVTAPSALRLLAPYLDEASLRVATRHAWTAAAGLYVVYGDPSRRSPEPPERAPGRDELVARAIETGGAHAIKLAEACLREHALAADPVLLQAAADGAATMRG